MKQFSKLLVAASLVLGVGANAQTEDNPWSITVGANAVDFYSAGNDGAIGNSGEDAKIFNEFFNVSDQWNMVPSISSITVGRYVGSGVSADLTGSFNKLDQYGNKFDENGNALSEDVFDEDNYFGLDLGVNYHLNTLWNGMNWLDPYVRGNAGYNWIADENGLAAGGGLGINFWLTENIAIKAQSVYKNNFAEELENFNHFQHTVGVNFSFGGKDTDGDGVYDKDDACVDVPGLAEFKGCPDTDGDGIQDSEDACVDTPGVAEFNGCADTDGDGVADPNDECVDVPGLKELNGCPDADGDGIADAKDGCPQEAGPAANNGCPWTDKDGDSVLDKDDQCPDVAGTVANNGCPEPSDVVVKQLNDYAKTILFNSGKSSFKDQTVEVLKAMNAIFKEYPQSKFALEGHTDSAGSAKSNQLLSERRANAVRDWFLANGIAADRLTAKGFGEDKPIDTNKTRAGRANNRRVEVKLVK
ncbi:OmpA family protein [Pseudofulvibacter geojedonensis]|uniref:OmpA family protein n=1 Tax=Pseudofulvibacter geojedonensis TaxID=1123758 RepID=A0ABW3I5J6_9FLAO